MREVVPKVTQERQEDSLTEKRTEEQAACLLSPVAHHVLHGWSKYTMAFGVLVNVALIGI